MSSMEKFALGMTVLTFVVACVPFVLGYIYRNYPEHLEL